MYVNLKYTRAREFKKDLNTQLRRREHIDKRKAQIKDPERMYCSQCTYRMDANTGRQQIVNKRENAPICVACCVGVKRKYNF